MANAELREQMGRIAPVVLAAEQVISVPEIFHRLLPGDGLQRGWTIRVEGSASSRALAWALLGEVTNAGGWVAAVNVPGVGLGAAAEVGVAIERVLVVDAPDAKAWSGAIGALIGAVDVIVFGAPQHRVTPSEHQKMASRARERGSVLMELGSASPTSRDPQLRYDLSFDVQPTEWNGLGLGHGRLRGRTLEVEASGSRIGGRTRSAQYELPAPDGTIAIFPARSSLPAIAASASETLRVPSSRAALRTAGGCEPLLVPRRSQSPARSSLPGSDPSPGTLRGPLLLDLAPAAPEAAYRRSSLAPSFGVSGV